MGAVSGDINSLAMECVDEADLASRPIASMKNGDRAYVESKAGSPEGALFFLDRGSTAAVDGVGVLAALGGVGRWLSEAFFPTPNMPSVGNLAELSAFDDASILDGGVAYVQSLRSYFQKRVVSPLPAFDGITVVSASSGTAAWYRLDMASPSWSVQAAWFIDPANGNDQNDGATSAAGGASADYVGALKTWAEFVRRVRNVNIGMTVAILSNIGEPLRGEFSTTSSTAYLVVAGQPTVLAYATGTTFVDPVPSTNTRGTVTATDLTVAATGLPGSFSSYVGKLMRAQAVDEYTHWPILRASSANVAQGGGWAQSLSTTKPVNGTRIEVIELVTAPTIGIVTNGLSVTARNFKFTSTATGDALIINPLRSLTTSRTGAGGVILQSTLTACEISQSVQGAQTWFIACVFTASSSAVTIVPQSGSTCTFNGGGSLRPINIWNPGIVQFQGFMVQGGRIAVGGLATSTNSPGTGAVVMVSSSLGVFDSPANTDGIVVTNGAAFHVSSSATLYGSGNGNYGMRVENGGFVRLPMTPTITGGSGDLLFNGAATAIPPLTAGAAVPAAAPLTTWGQWAAAPFNKFVMNYATGSRILGS